MWKIHTLIIAQQEEEPLVQWMLPSLHSYHLVPAKRPPKCAVLRCAVVPTLVQALKRVLARGSTVIHSCEMCADTSYSPQSEWETFGWTRSLMSTSPSGLGVHTDTGWPINPDKRNYGAQLRQATSGSHDARNLLLQVIIFKRKYGKHIQPPGDHFFPVSLS